MMIRGLELGQDVQPGDQRFVAADFHGATDQFMNVDGLELEP